MIALVLIALQIGEKSELLARLDPFSQHTELQGLGKGDDGLDDRGVFLVIGNFRADDSSGQHHDAPESCRTVPDV